MLVPITRYECNKSGSVISADMLNDYKRDGKDIICPFCYMTSNVYDVNCSHRLIGIFDHFNSTIWGNIADAVFIEDNGITNPRLVIRLRYDYLYSISI